MSDGIQVFAGSEHDEFEIRQAPPPNTKDDLAALAEFIPGGVVSWQGSPLVWLLGYGPPTKSKLARDAARMWLRREGFSFSEAGKGEAGTFGFHYDVQGVGKIAVHFAAVDKQGHFMYSQVRSPEHGIEWHLLLGIEPFRITWMWLHTSDVTKANGFQTEKAWTDGDGNPNGLHRITFEPKNLPSYILLASEEKHGAHA